MLDKAIINQYSGLIFDMDGTLIDSMTCHAKAWEKVGEVIGYPLSGDVMYQFAGASVHTIARETMKKYGVPITEESVNRVVQLKRDFGREILQKEAALLPAFKVVAHFHGKKPLALGTGSLKEITQMLMTKLDLHQYFNAVVTAEDVTKHKPHPETFLRCAELIQQKPAQCLVFEDADLGVQAALAGGMHVFDVRTHELIKK
ncbi:beta-phosphoglucomutase family hydrolase [Cricetibacter osteomyelitidis]|uniref:beta-phosphoglucomutase family hydrolase n=1 Tax=Cricetibacter osteomyelitidis TaxID=1521931 RepID=UPI00104B1EB4|nr:beta-phosphoglucomutase family hydrolase [Cricetibacter osteomyelitidis]